MARPQTPPIFAQMRHARSCLEQVAALRALKNDITGHIQKKERWVEHGILDHIVRLLQVSRSSQGQNGKDIQGGSESRSKDLSDQEQVRLQALQLLSIFAKGGPSFLKPLHETGAVSAILTNIFPLDNPNEVVVTALRALHSITEATTLSAQAASSLSALADLVFTPHGLGAFHTILESGSETNFSLEQKHLVAALVGRLCKEDKHQEALANYGLLDDLAILLAKIVVARGEVVPGAAEQGKPHGLDELIPNPAPPGAKLDVILEAIAAIIAESRFRACLFICSPALLAAFPYVEFNPLAKVPRAARDALEMAGLASIRWRLGAMDYLLPAVPVVQHKPQSTPFPSLGFSVSRQSSAANRNGNSRSASQFSFWDAGHSENSSTSAEPESDDVESPLIPWLIHLIRSTGGLDRVMAASVLASLFKAGFANSDREAMIGCLVVPPLCTLIKEASEEVIGTTSISSDTTGAWAILDRAPAVLARLIAGSELLQKAAHDNGAIKRVGKLLVESYSKSTEHLPPRPWSPTSDRALDEGGHMSTSRLGEPGLLPLKAHRLRLRESALKLIAAIIPLKDEYRKLFAAEQDAVGYVVESLKVCPSKPNMTKDRAKPEKETEETNASLEESPYGNNPKSVIIAACHVVRLLSRSISILRTYLWDYGVGQPLFRLLRHPDTEVQVAACSAVCNLILKVSPVQEHLLELGIVKVLCEHAHSQDAGLRLEAMWSLKHLAKDAGADLKKQCLDELEPGWLVQLICVDTEDDALFARRTREKQLHDDGDELMDTETRREYEYEEERKWLWPGLYRTSSTGPASQRRAQSPRMLKAETKLLALREAELDPVRKARNDDLAVQEQALGFIRNLLMCSTERADDQTEMVDYLFSELGQDRVFEILTSKLKTRVLHPFARGQSGRDTRVVYPQARVIEHVIYILVHIAASIPRHRQLVIAQTELLKQVGQHFNSKDGLVRVAVCQLLSNLVWKDDQNDQEACQQRKAELKRLGFESKLQGLVSDDSELDVREKARVAAWEMKS